MGLVGLLDAPGGPSRFPVVDALRGVHFCVGGGGGGAWRRTPPPRGCDAALEGAPKAQHPVDATCAYYYYRVLTLKVASLPERIRSEHYTSRSTSPTLFECCHVVNVSR